MSQLSNETFVIKQSSSSSPSRECLVDNVSHPLTNETFTIDIYSDDSINSQYFSCSSSSSDGEQPLPDTFVKVWPPSSPLIHENPSFEVKICERQTGCRDSTSRLEEDFTPQLPNSQPSFLCNTFTVCSSKSNHSKNSLNGDSIAPITEVTEARLATSDQPISLSDPCSTNLSDSEIFQCGQKFSWSKKSNSDCDVLEENAASKTSCIFTPVVGTTVRNIELSHSAESIKLLEVVEKCKQALQSSESSDKDLPTVETHSSISLEPSLPHDRKQVISQYFTPEVHVDLGNKPPCSIEVETSPNSDLSHSTNSVEVALINCDKDVRNLNDSSNTSSSFYLMSVKSSKHRSKGIKTADKCCSDPCYRKTSAEPVDDVTLNPFKTQSCLAEKGNQCHQIVSHSNYLGEPSFAIHSQQISSQDLLGSMELLNRLGNVWIKDGKFFPSLSQDSLFLILSQNEAFAYFATKLQENANVKISTQKSLNEGVVCEVQKSAASSAETCFSPLEKCCVENSSVMNFASFSSSLCTVVEMKPKPESAGKNPQQSYSNSSPGLSNRCHAREEVSSSIFNQAYLADSSKEVEIIRGNDEKTFPNKKNRESLIKVNREKKSQSVKLPLTKDRELNAGSSSNVTCAEMNYCGAILSVKSDEGKRKKPKIISTCEENGESSVNITCAGMNNCGRILSVKSNENRRKKPKILSTCENSSPTCAASPVEDGQENDKNLTNSAREEKNPLETNSSLKDSRVLSSSGETSKPLSSTSSKTRSSTTNSSSGIIESSLVTETGIHKSLLKSPVTRATAKKATFSSSSGSGLIIESPVANETEDGIHKTLMKSPVTRATGKEATDSSSSGSGLIIESSVTNKTENRITLKKDRSAPNEEIKEKTSWRQRRKHFKKLTIVTRRKLQRKREKLSRVQKHSIPSSVQEPIDISDEPRQAMNEACESSSDSECCIINSPATRFLRNNCEIKEQFQKKERNNHNVESNKSSQSVDLTPKLITASCTATINKSNLEHLVKKCHILSPSVEISKTARTSNTAENFVATTNRASKSSKRTVEPCKIASNFVRLCDLNYFCVNSLIVDRDFLEYHGLLPDIKLERVDLTESPKNRKVPKFLDCSVSLVDCMKRKQDLSPVAGPSKKQKLESSLSSSLSFFLSRGLRKGVTLSASKKSCNPRTESQCPSSENRGNSLKESPQIPAVSSTRMEQISYLGMKNHCFKSPSGDRILKSVKACLIRTTPRISENIVSAVCCICKSLIPYHLADKEFVSCDTIWPDRKIPVCISKECERQRLYFGVFKIKLFLKLESGETILATVRSPEADKFFGCSVREFFSNAEYLRRIRERISDLLVPREQNPPKVIFKNYNLVFKNKGKSQQVQVVDTNLFEP